MLCPYQDNSNTLENKEIISCNAPCETFLSNNKANITVFSCYMDINFSNTDKDIEGVN